MIILVFCMWVLSWWLKKWIKDICFRYDKQLCLHNIFFSSTKAILLCQALPDWGAIWKQNIHFLVIVLSQPIHSRTHALKCIHCNINMYNIHALRMHCINTLKMHLWTSYINTSYMHKSICINNTEIFWLILTEIRWHFHADICTHSHIQIV